MLFKLTNISVLIFVATLVNIFTTYVSWQRRKARGGVYFAFAMLAVTFWTLSAGLDYAAVPFSLKVFFAKLESVGYMSAIALYTAFALSYAGSDDWLKKSLIRLLLIGIPVSNLLLVWTNELHGWIWMDFKANPAVDNVLIFVHGPAFIWVAVSGYTLILIIFVSLLRASLNGTELARKQARLLLLALLALIASNLLYLFDFLHVPGVDWSSITFSITGLLFLSALYGSRFLDIVPVARNTLIERMADGILVVDAQGNLVDFNPAAQNIFGLAPGDLWKPIQVALACWPEVIGYLQAEPEKMAREVSLGPGSKVFDLRANFLEDNRAQIYGKLIIFREITDRKQTEETLRQSEEKFYKAFQADPDAILITQLDHGRIMEVNDAFCHLFGYSRAEALASTTIQLGLWMNQSDRDALVHDLQELGSVRERECQFRAKSGELIIANYSGEIILLGGEKHVISTVHDLTRRKWAEQELQASQAQVMAQQQELARVEERQRMARNLHDSLSQSIHSLVLFSETLEATLQKENFERARKIAKQVQESARQAHKETRLLLYELQASDPERNLDLVRALNERLAKVERHTGLKAELIAEGREDEILPEWRENLYWIAIEALNNSLKHARARSVQVVLRSSPERLVLEIYDDGRGFDPDRVPGGGLGLDNLRTRAQLLGGRLTIESGPERGTWLRFSIEKKVLSESQLENPTI